jgi:hypothetical protein
MVCNSNFHLSGRPKTGHKKTAKKGGFGTHFRGVKKMVLSLILCGFQG